MRFRATGFRRALALGLKSFANKKSLYAVTGPLASGKSSTAKRLLAASPHYRYFNSDRFVAKLYAQQNIRALVARKINISSQPEGFSARVLAAIAQDNRKWLTLEKTIHPLIAKGIIQSLRGASKAKQKLLAELPLIAETHSLGLFSKTFFCQARLRVRQQRHAQRGLESSLFGVIARHQRGLLIAPSSSAWPSRSFHIIPTDGGKGLTINCLRKAS